jgi:peptidoglycan/LPS O-acetylase OafA/YrhL
VYWTLEIELVFYAGMLALFLLGLIEPRRLVGALGVWVGLSLAFTLLRPSLDGVPRVDLFARLTILAWIPIFALGVVIRLASEHRKLTAGQSALAALALLAVSATHGLEALAFVAGAAALVAFAVLVRPRALRFAPLVKIGVWSYGLYLVHQNIGYAIIRAAGDAGLHPWVGFAAAVAVTIAIAAALHRLVERPALALSRGRAPAPKAAPAASLVSATPVIPADTVPPIGLTPSPPRVNPPGIARGELHEQP